MTFNISGLQDINDAYGYEVGDQLLQAFGQRLEGVPGEQVLAGRIGGDEFTLFSLLGSALALEPYLTDLIQSLTRPVDLANVNIDVTFRLGYTRFGKHQRPIENLLRESERALSLHRQNAFVPWVAFSSQIKQEIQKRIELARELRTALSDDQFELHFQPKVDLVTGKLLACEALIRWNHPTRGLGVWLSLDDFGTGYSSLLYLQRYPFNEIKIDQAFVIHMLDDPFSCNIIEMVITLAKALSAEVIAEGIESAAVSRALIDMGCRSGQGFFYSMPLEAEDFRWLLEQRSKLPLTIEHGQY